MLRRATGREINRRQGVQIQGGRYSIYRIVPGPDGRLVRQFVGWADNMGEAVRRAHEVWEESRQGHIEAVEVINRGAAADVAVYRINHSEGT